MIEQWDNGRGKQKLSRIVMTNPDRGGPTTIRYSDDGGASWSEPIEIKADGSYPPHPQDQERSR